MKSANVAFRAATAADADAIAKLHVAVWRQTYENLAPVKAFAILDEGYRLASWKGILATPRREELLLLAEEGASVVGFARAGAPSHAVFGGRGEIRSIYIGLDFQRRGIGRRMLSTLAVHLRDQGYKGAALGVVAGNLPAIAFYEALGARVVGRYLDPGPIWRSKNIAMAWDDFAHLIEGHDG